MLLMKKWFKSYNLKKTIHPSIPYHYPLLKRFYLRSVYVGFGIVTAFSMSVMLWNAHLLYNKHYLYLVLSITATKIPYSKIYVQRFFYGEISYGEISLRWNILT